MSEEVKDGNAQQQAAQPEGAEAANSGATRCGHAETDGAVGKASVATDDRKPSVTFLPERFIRRDIEVLAIRLESAADAERAGPGAKPGDWLVTDDRGRKHVVSNDDFQYDYRENEAHGGPGKINLLLPGINALGCRAVLFGASAGQSTGGTVQPDRYGDDAANAGRGPSSLDAELNEWFERPEHFGLAIAHSMPLPSGALLVWVTRPMTEREIKERGEVAEETRALINKRHEDALAQQAKAIEDALAAENAAKEQAEMAAEENKRYVELGKKHEQNCPKRRLEAVK